MSILEGFAPLTVVTLVLGAAGSIAVLAGALALGIRHGIDWDHIAAITDITSTTAAAQDPEEEWLTGEPGVLLTDESHHSHAAEPLRAKDDSEPLLVGANVSQTEVFSLSGAPLSARLGPKRGHQAWSLHALLAKQRRPLFLGTMYALGHGTVVTILGLLAILSSQFLPDWIDPIMERVVGTTLLFLAAYLFYSLYRFFRSGGEFRLRSRWMLVFAGVRNGFRWLRAKIRGEQRHVHVPVSQYGARTAYTVGLIHGIGAETGTQVLVIATAVGAGSKAMGIAALLAFVVGLLISNSFVTIISTTGFLSTQSRQRIYVLAGLIAAIFSLTVGLVFLFPEILSLPNLDSYFRWLGGPSS